MPGDTRQISWNANPEPEVLGYKLYAGPLSGVYNDPASPHDFGLVTSGQFTPDDEATRFYALTAYNSVGESDFSAEVEFILPEIFIAEPGSYELIGGT